MKFEEILIGKLYVIKSEKDLRVSDNVIWPLWTHEEGFCNTDAWFHLNGTVQVMVLQKTCTNHLSKVEAIKIIEIATGKIGFLENMCEQHAYIQDFPLQLIEQ